MNGALSIERPGECHPQLHGQMTALLEEVENRAGTPNTADQAEDALVEHMRQIGRQAGAGPLGRAAPRRSAARPHTRPAPSR